MSTSYCNPDPVEPLVPVCEDPEYCEELFDSKCIAYTGDDLEALNILKNERLDSVVTKINDYVSGYVDKAYVDNIANDLNGEITTAKSVAQAAQENIETLDAVKADKTYVDSVAGDLNSEIITAKAMAQAAQDDVDALDTVKADTVYVNTRTTPVISDALAGALRVSDTVYNILDKRTGQPISLSKTTLNEAGAAITDSDVDNAVYFKIGTEYFKRNYTGPVHTDWFGFKKDGTNERTLLQKIVSTYKNIIIDKGTITVPAVRNCILLQSDQTIEFAVGAKIRGVYDTAGPGDGTYQILRGSGVSNVSIVNPVIQGDRTDSPLTDGEHGMCIYFSNSVNINITGGELYDAWGDGIYITGDNSESNPDNGTRNISIGGRINIHNCRRQGITLVAGRYINIDNIFFKDIAGTDPQAAIDIEPNLVGQIVDIVNITNCMAVNCQHGYVSNGRNVTIQNCHIVNARGRGFWIAAGEDLGIAGNGGNVTIVNCTVNGWSSEYNTDNDYAEAVRIVAPNVTVKNCKFLGGGNRGALIGGSVSDISIIDCDFENITREGIITFPASDISKANRMKITGNKVKNAQVGIAHKSGSFYIGGNTIEDSAEYGMIINANTNGAGSIAEKNTIRRSDRHGIDVQTNGVNVIDNTIESSSLTIVSWRAISVTGSKNILKGNTVIKGSGLNVNGIEIKAGSDANVVLDTISTGFNTPVLNNGTNSIIRTI